ncbi:MAG: hypothetical protein ACOC5J_00310 [Gemmatimonadota bacterium]
MTTGSRKATGRGFWTRVIGAIVPALGLLLVVGCGGGESGEEPAGGSTEESAAQAPEPEQPQAAQPQTVGDIFPEGEGRSLVLNECASCHAAACAAIGQRSPSRWEALQDAHREHIPGMSEEDLETVFTYLQSNFDDSQPEPEIPAAFLQEGCTPF